MENCPINGNISFSAFKSIQETYGMQVCLDVAHAFSWSPQEIEQYVSHFSSSIFQLHLSGSEGTHQHLPTADSSSAFQTSISTALRLDKPIIVESDYRAYSTKAIMQDITFIQQLVRPDASSEYPSYDGIKQ